MFRKMRRIRQQMADADAIGVLENGKGGILTVNGDDGYPYPVPMNYAYIDGKIYLHSANVGHKIDAIKASDKVSFLVVDKDDVIEDKLTTAYRSVVVFGRAGIVEDDQKKMSLVMKFALKYSKNMPAIHQDIDENFKSMALIEITPEHITGKEGMEIIRTRMK